MNTQIKMLAQKLKEAKSGSAVITINKNIVRDDRFLTTRTFPYHLQEIPQLLTKFRQWQEIIEAAPHLFQKQKVIYFLRSGFSFPGAKVADKFYKNEFDKKSVKLKSLNDFSFLKNNNKSAVIFQEYRFNYARFFIEALKYFESIGGKVELTDEPARDFKGQLPAVLIPAKAYPHFVARTKENRSVIQFSGESNKISAFQQDKQTAALTKNDLLIICKNYFSFDPEKAKEIIISAPPSTDVFHDIVTQIMGRLSCSFESTQLKDYYEICLEKFDLAKQTGISFEEFKIYFHRYGKAIDEITETAYQLLGQTRNPGKLWEEAEQEYQKKYEWYQIKK